MESTKKSIVSVVLLGAILAGGYMLFADSKDVQQEQNATSYIRTDNSKQTRSYLSTGEMDKDCKDFKTQREAQSFFEANSGPESDPHNLDRDGDGRVCESLK